MSIRHWVSDQVISAGTPIQYHIQISPPTPLAPFHAWALPPALCHVKRPVQHTPTHSMWTVLIIPLKDGTYFIPSQSFEVATGPPIQLAAIPIRVLPAPTHYEIEAPFDWVLPPLPIAPLIGIGLFIILIISGAWVVSTRTRRPMPPPTPHMVAPDGSAPTPALLLLLDTLNQGAHQSVPTGAERHQLRHLFRQVIAERYGLDPQWERTHLYALVGEDLDHDTIITLDQAGVVLDRAVFSNDPIARNEWVTALMPLRHLLFKWVQAT